MICVVLGMGFSGTTLVSELLHHSGIVMIEQESDRYDDGGKYEDPRFQALNKRMLGLRDDRVFHLLPRQCPARVEPALVSRMRALVRERVERGMDWGFKDPRTVVTYPRWRELLPPHRIIAVYRDPAGNWPRHRWQGYRKRHTNAWRAFVHLRQWCEYNAAILEYGASCAGGFLLINYERLMKGDEEISRLAAFVGHDIEDRRNPGMYRTRGRGDLLFRSVRWCMDRGAGGYHPRNVMAQLEEVRRGQVAGRDT